MARVSVMSHQVEDAIEEAPAPPGMPGGLVEDPMGGILPPSTHVLLRDRLARFVVRLLLSVLFRVQIDGLDRIPRGRPVICTANHASWLDPFLLLAFLPLAPRRYTIGNATATLNPPWRRTVIAPFHALIPLDRARPQAAIRAMETILARGNTLIIFPEGQLGTEGQVLPLQSGTAYLAHHTGLPILTVGITGSGDLWFRKHIIVRFGSCLDYADYPRASSHARRQALLSDLRAHIQALLVPQPAHHGLKLFRHTLTKLF